MKDRKSRKAPLLKSGLEFEELCYDIFKSKGIKVQVFDTFGIDFILETRQIERVAVYVKFYLTKQPSKVMLRKSLFSLKESATKIGVIKNIFIVGCPLDKEIKFDLTKEFPNTSILDSNNLLFLINNDVELIDRFYRLMNEILFDVRIDSEKPFDCINDFIFNDIPNTSSDYKEALSLGNKLYRDLKEIRAGRNEFSLYEKKGEEILKYLFDQNLKGWHPQVTTDDGLNRYDLVCRILRGNEFWEYLINDFQSRYIIFEFKNYSQKIKQTEIYTTEKYLFQTALRNVCFIISRRGLSDSALKATDGILRETGKLIIGLDDKDLRELLNLKDTGNEPSDYLFEKIDNTLLRLSK
ncbi:restriction endonuclease [Bacillus sp. D386]|uniref:restriction endonuclease n=1 Tax=Bacillus sp. D386 TaxID=2587155 RepID=UPI001121F372|nr:restriction endonuclease [Bacillus sp. D386]